MHAYKPYLTLFIAFVMLFCPCGRAEQTTFISPVDSLRQVYKNVSPAEKLNFFNDIIIILEFSNPDSALFYGNAGLKYAEKNNLQNTLQYAYLLNNIAAIYIQMAEYQKVLELLTSSLPIMEQHANLNGMAITNSQMGQLYTYMRMYEKAQHHLNIALDFYKTQNDKNGIASVYNGMGVMYYNMNDKSRALDYFKLFLKLAEDEKNLQQISTGLNNVAVINEELGNLDEALHYYKRSLQLGRELAFKIAIAVSMQNMAVLYLKQKKYTLARIYLDSSIVLNKELNAFSELKELYSSYSELCIRTGHENDAIQYKNLALEAQDSALGVELQNAIVEHSIRYDTEKKELENNALRIEAARQATENERQRIVITAVSAGLILFLLLAVFIYRGYRQKQQANQIITQQKKEVETQKKLLEEKNKDIIDSITYARRIQESILPNAKLWHSYFPDSFILYLPKDIVAGDFYWMEETAQYIFVAAADCTGHGVPGAMVSVVCSTALTKCVLEEYILDTNRILDRTREIVVEKLSRNEDNAYDGMDICLIRMEKSNPCNIQYSGANRPLYYTENEKLTEVLPDKQPIGRHAKEHPFTASHFVFSIGVRIYLTTDGFADQFGGVRNKKMGIRRMESLLLEKHPEGMKKQGETLKRFFHDWKKDIFQVDDVTMLGIKI